MNTDVVVERLFEALVAGDRLAARSVVRECVERGMTAQSVITDVLWTEHELIEKLHRSDQMSQIAYHLSTRLLRNLVDQVGARLPIDNASGKRVFCVCGKAEGEELAAQMAVDLLESRGHRVAFAGGGVPGDEIMAQVHDSRPDILLMFASAASDLPDIRSVVDRIREIGACPGLQIIVGGGVFNRAEGLADEMGIELWASDPLDLVELIASGATSNTVIEERPAKKATRRRRAA